MTDPAIEKLKHRSGKGAMAAWKLLDYLFQDELLGWRSLRDGYATVMDFADSKGATISIPLIKIVKKEMMEAGLIKQRKTGRSYQLAITEKGTEFWGWVYQENPEYGKSEDYVHPSTDLDLLKSAREALAEKPIGIVLDGATGLVWSLAKKYKEQNELETAFVPKGYDVFIRKTGTKEKPTRLPKFPGASVSDQK